MLVTRGLRGLGADKVIDWTGGGTIVSQSNPVFPRIVTWSQLEAERKAQALEIGTRDGLFMRGVAATMNVMCPPSSIGVVGGKGCYNGGPSNPTELVPGAFQMLGVPFNVGEIGLSKTSRFDRTFTPNTEQRLQIEYAVAARSREVAQSVIEAAVARESGSTSASVIKGIAKKLSINQVRSLVPDLVMSAFNLSILPPPPTASEMSSEGGYAAWISRGGWPIYTPVIHGQAQVWGELVSPLPCASISCRCGADPWPACIKMGLPGDEHGGWNVFIAIDQAAPWTFHMGIAHQDPGWITKVGNTLAEYMTKLGNVFCSGQPVIKSQMASVLTEKCVDKNGKPCTKGAAGCTCIKPSAATTGSVGLANFVASKWCAGWAAEQVVYDPSTAIPPTPDQPALPPSFINALPIPLWVIGALGVLGGAVWFSRR